MKSLLRITIPLLVALATQSNAHEFWLEPKNFQGSPGETVEIDLRNGQDFRGQEMSWYDPRIARAQVVRDGKSEDYQGRPGDLPGMTVELGNGLTEVAYASRMSRLTYDSWEKVMSFTTEKDIADFAARHAARGFPQEGVTEGYWRFSKTLLSGGADGTGSDTGMETEFIALSDPYAPGADSIRLQLIYQGARRPDAQVEMWEKRAGDVSKTLHRTDDAGHVTLPLRPGSVYMVDAVILREPASDRAREAGVMWESLWANLTYAVPE
ncbi:DUF4198 domain-containing protein [Pseudooceanicola sp.]